MHPLVAVVLAGIANEDDHRRAREDAAGVDGLLAQALAVPDGSAGSYSLFGVLVQRLERILSPWCAVFPAEPVIGWRESLRRHLYTRARALFGRSGELLAPRPLEPGPSMMARRGGPRRLFRW
jgi:hypothetical protein